MKLSFESLERMGFEVTYHKHDQSLEIRTVEGSPEAFNTAMELAMRAGLDEGQSHTLAEEYMMTINRQLVVKAITM